MSEAYTQLIAEGWLTARTGSGTRVAPRAGVVLTPRRRPDPLASTRPKHDLSPGRPDAGAFPRRAWAAAMREVVTNAPAEAFGYGDPRGRPELRATLAAYLGRVRGTRCAPEQIIVCSGYTQALGLLAQVFAGLLPRGEPAGRVAMENPALNDHVSIVSTLLPVVDIPVDAAGLDVARLVESGAGAVVCTPSHQFPSGVQLSPERREALIAWTRSRSGWVVEDDYDGEFNYERHPVSALQPGNPDRIVYVGSTSKSLGPAMRLGWILCPEQLVAPLVEAKRLADRQTNPLDQLALAAVMANGAYDRHLAAMRRRYRSRRKELLTAIERHLPGARVLGLAAGLHAIIELPAGAPPEPAVMAALRTASIRVHPYADYARGGGDGQSRTRVIVGYAAPSSHSYAAALEALVRTLRLSVPPSAAQPKTPPPAGAGTPDGSWLPAQGRVPF